MKRLLILTLNIIICAAALHAQKKPKPEPEPAKTYPTERVFPVSCDAVWPAAIQTLATNGWAIKTSDRAGGLLTFDRTVTERLRSHKDFIVKYTTGKTTGFWTIYTGFRFNQSQAIMTRRDEKCSLMFNLSYDYYGSVGAGTHTQWWNVPSNGWFEDKMLTEIEAKLKAAN